MKRILSIFAILAFALRLPAQTNDFVRLALVPETDDVSALSDVLTAQLSGNPQIHLLERSEIEKIFREQGLSAANRNYLKLGQILGADGLFLLNISKTASGTNLMTRLVAVKQGVVLLDDSFPWPLQDLVDWSSGLANHLMPFLPKLTVLEKDAIPISVLNLRSALASDEASETERQIKLLTIQRLAKAPQLFVLERQRMNLLGEEKELQPEDSPFWNGSYLFEGILDQNGYSKEIITLNERLIPPKGGAPLLIEVSGARTNLAELVNRLAIKVEESLKIPFAAHEWNAADEAQQYYVEAGWALRWGVNSEAQMAADSAWALGKHDLDCALVRVKAYLAELTAHNVFYDTTTTCFPPIVGPNGVIIPRTPKDSDVRSEIKRIQTQHPTGMSYSLEEVGGAEVIQYIIAGSAPNPVNLDRAVRALELYDDFSRSSPGGEPKVLPRGGRWNDWHNSDWYQLGIDDLIEASRVLQDFYFVPESQMPVGDKLAVLRALARSVADLISRSPSVHDSYFIGDRTVASDELAKTIGQCPNIFSCKLTWGSLWQESPEDGVALYRDLMASPVFGCIHRILWLHQLQAPVVANPFSHSFEPPRLAVWNGSDGPRVVADWKNFLKELDRSTNVLLPLEAKALRFADAEDENGLKEAFTNLLDAFVDNRIALLTNKVELLHMGWSLESMDWGVDSLVNAQTTKEIYTEAFRTTVANRFHNEYLPKLAAKEVEYGNLVLQNKNRQAFETQKRFLIDNQPFNPQAFARMFRSGFKDYSVAQAIEIQPLLTAYKTNLPGNFARIGAALVGQVQLDLSRVLTPPAPRATTAVFPPAPSPAVSTKPLVVGRDPIQTALAVTNVLVVDKYFEIPLEALADDKPDRFRLTAHHWMEGKLLLDFQYLTLIYSFDEKGAWSGTRSPTLRGLAILDPKTEHWDVLGCSEVDFARRNDFYHRSVLWRGGVFTCDGGEINRYDFDAKKWKTLEVSDGANYELFVVNERLYAANGIAVLEIMAGGKSSRILASTRRQPPMSALDTQDLGTPTLFEGPRHSLRIVASKRIFTWTGNDWSEDFAAPPSSFAPAISADGVLFATDGFGQAASICRVATESNSVEFCLGQKALPQGNFNFFRSGTNADPHVGPKWKLPPDLSLANLPSASRQRDLYLLADHSIAHEIADEHNTLTQVQVVGKDGWDAEMLCFSRDATSAKKIPLKFSAPDACPPLAGIDPSSRRPFPGPPPAWMLFGSNWLFFGLENSGRAGTGYKPGVWLMPVSRLDAE